MTDLEKELRESFGDGSERLQMIIESQSSPESLRLREKLNSFRPLFEDMITPENDFSYDSVFLSVDPYTVSWGGQFNSCDLSIAISSQEYKHRPNIALLHEMIHLHIFKMAEGERLQCKERLEKELRASVPRLDTIMELKDLAMDALYSLHESWELPEASGHDDLFFFKSLDIDQKKKYKLGTVFEYGMNQCIRYIQEAIEGNRVEAITNHWRNMIKKREGSS